MVTIDARRKVSAGQIVMLHAMALGKPLVVSDMPHLREYACDQASVLVPAGDPQALLEAIRDLSSLRFDRLARMGRAGYEWAKGRFSAEHFNHRFTSELL